MVEMTHELPELRPTSKNVNILRHFKIIIYIYVYVNLKNGGIIFFIQVTELCHYYLIILCISNTQVLFFKFP